VTALHVVVPDAIDDPERPSGGNTYDRRVCRELASLGWSVHEHAVPGFWARPGAAALTALGDVVRRIPDDGLVLLDGMLASPGCEVLVAHARRLRLVVLVHMALGNRPPAGEAEEIRRREGAILSASARVVTTSAWSRRRLLELYALQAGHVEVAEPGVDAADLAPGSATGGALLCVGAVSFEKGHDLLLEALEAVSDLSWQCVCVGSLERDPACAQELRRRSREHGLSDRVSFPGTRIGAGLDRAYAAADLLVLASRAETYGMVLTEALARGLPVLAAEAGGVSEAVGRGADGTRPGLLVAPEDPQALGDALRAWLTDATLRGRLRNAARERRESLPGWPATAAVLAAVLLASSR
jgi:glycosyltransferase involved in cell wall biosynthesis